MSELILSVAFATMSVFISTSSLLLVLGLVPGIVSLDNGLSRTPAMAFNGYNAFACVLFMFGKCQSLIEGLRGLE